MSITRYILLGIGAGSLPYYYTGRDFVSYRIGTPGAREWKTLDGILKFIKKENEAGSNWALVVLPVERRGA